MLFNILGEAALVIVAMLLVSYLVLRKQRDNDVN